MKAYWKPITAVAIFSITQLLMGVILVVIGYVKGVNVSTSPTYLATSIILSGIVTIALLFALRMVKLKTFDPRRTRWNLAPMAIIGALMGIFAMDLIGEQLNLQDYMKEEFQLLANNLWGILAIVVVGPLVEELVFREAIIVSLMHHRVHRKRAILISAIAFGLIHANPAQIPFALIAGIILGTIFVRTRSIVLPLIIHFINNGIAVIEIRLLGQDIEEFKLSDILGGTMAAWCYIIICSTMCIIFLRQFWKKHHRKHIKKHRRHIQYSV